MDVYRIIIVFIVKFQNWVTYMQKDQVYKNFKHKMPNVGKINFWIWTAFLKKVVKESFVMPLDMIQVNFKFTLDNLEQIFKAKLSVVRTMQDKVLWFVCI